MGFIKRLRKRFGGKKQETTGTSDPFTYEMEKMLKAYKVRGDMIEKYKSTTAFMDHSEEYEQRMAAEPVPSWEHSELITSRLQMLVALYPPKLPDFVSDLAYKEQEDASKS